MSSLAADKLQEEPVNVKLSVAPSIDSGCSVTSRSVSETHVLPRPRSATSRTSRSISASVSMSRLPVLSTRTRKISQLSSEGSIRQSQSMHSFSEFGVLPRTTSKSTVSSTPVRKRIYGSIGVGITSPASPSASVTSFGSASMRRSSSIRSMSAQSAANLQMRKSSSARSLSEVRKTIYKASKARTLDKEIAVGPVVSIGYH